MCTPLSCERDLTDNILQDFSSLANRTIPLHACCLNARLFLQSVTGPRVSVVPHARVSFELNPSSKFPGAACLESTKHQTHRCHNVSFGSTLQSQGPTPNPHSTSPTRASIPNQIRWAAGNTLSCSARQIERSQAGSQFPISQRSLRHSF